MKTRICKYNKCNKIFQPKKNNPAQAYCNEKCWALANGIKENK